MVKKRAFISFDYDNDKVLKDFIIGQAKKPDSPFEVIDWSMKEAALQANWEQEAERRIKNVEVMIVMVGQKTYCASGVLKEVRITRKHNKKIVQIIGYRDGKYRQVPEAGVLYSWNWDNLKKILS